MGQGILRDFVFIHSIGWGDIAVELGNGHVQIMPCAVRLKDSYKGKLVSWDCDSSGVVTRLSVVSYRRNKILLAGGRAHLAGVRAHRARMRSSIGKATGPGIGGRVGSSFALLYIGLLFCLYLKVLS